MRCSNDDVVRAVRHELVVRLKSSRCRITRNDAGSRRERHVLLIVVERIPTLKISRAAHHPVDFCREQFFVERVRGEAREAGGLSRIMERRAVLIVPLVVEKEKEFVMHDRTAEGAAVLFTFKRDLSSLRVNWDTVRRVEPCERRECRPAVVANIEISVAMKLVRS